MLPDTGIQGDGQRSPDAYAIDAEISNRADATTFEPDTVIGKTPELVLDDGTALQL